LEKDAVDRRVRQAGQLAIRIGANHDHRLQVNAYQLGGSAERRFLNSGALEVSDDRPTPVSVSLAETSRVDPALSSR
jgi:hypothetical protein